MPDTADVIAMALHAAEGSALERGEIPSYGMWADFVLEALKRAGYEVVKLPEPDKREDEDQEFTDFPGIGLYVPVVFDRHPGEVQIRAGAWCDEPLSVDEARELAASILAAADAAEVAE